MLNLGMLTALGKEHELKLHIRGALNNGLTKDEIKEVFLQVAIYCGVPAAVVAFRVARRGVQGTRRRSIDRASSAWALWASLWPPTWRARAFGAVLRPERNGQARARPAKRPRARSVLITMLPDGDVVREAVLEALPGLRPGAIVVDMSSSDPARNARARRRTGGEAASPCSTRRSPARWPRRADGTLAIMVGGDARGARSACSGPEDDGQPRSSTAGPLGAGHAVKALNNYLGAAGTLAGFEALLIASAFGLDPKPMLDAINASTGRNSTTERKIPQQVLTGAFASGFRLALMAKDVGIAAELARELRVQAPYLKETLRLWRDAPAALPPGPTIPRSTTTWSELKLSISRRSFTAVAAFASKATSLHLSGWPAATGLQQLPAVREAERQAALREGVLRRHQPARPPCSRPRRRAFRPASGPSSPCNRVGAPAGRAAGRLAAQADRRDRNADLQPDQVPALVQARVAARRIGLHAVLREAALDVLGLALEHDEHAEADVVRNRACRPFSSDEITSTCPL